MLPIAPHDKIYIESAFLVVLLGYVLWNVKRPHLTSAVCVGLSVPLLIDVFILHAIRSLGVTVALNVPFMLMVLAFIYVKILRKTWLRVRQKLTVLAMLLAGD